MLTRVDPPIPLTTPKGSGLAHFVIDYGVEHHLIWVVFLDETGEIWSFENHLVRADNNFTMGRNVKHNPVGGASDDDRLV